MFGKRFTQEFYLIEQALLSEEGEKRLFEYVRPTVERTVNEYIKSHGVSGDFVALHRAGWTYFGVAIKGYHKRAVAMMDRRTDDLYYFESYFAWYIRQGVVEYLQGRTDEQETEELKN